VLLPRASALTNLGRISDPGFVFKRLRNLRAGGAIEMQIDFVTIQRHACEKLRKIENQPNPAQRLIALKKFLKIETQRLSLRHRFGVSGERIVQARSLIVDLLIERIGSTNI
jgi:hypothetical protein